MKISVSFLSSKYNFKETIEKINNSKADFLHVDVMDGKFVENKNFDKEELSNLLSISKKPLDIHLMVNDPINWISYLQNLNIDCLTIHQEVLKNNDGVIKLIKEKDIKVGLAINPETKIESFISYLEKIDRILVLSVNPGKGGQQFLTSQVKKINKLKELQTKYDFELEVDGGINDKTIKLIPNIDIIVSGSYICNSDDFDGQINNLIK